MTLTQLTYIVAVDQHRHFGAAAEACFVTQPTLSMQVQKLEEEFDIEIFDRTKQPVEPTATGRQVIEQARVILSEAQRIGDIVRNLRDEISGPLKLGIIPTLASSILPLFLKSFVNKYPRLEVSVEEVQTHQIIDRLKDGTLDIGLLVTPLSDGSIIERPLFNEPFLLYTSPEHPLAKAKKVTEKDLSSEEIWLLSEGHCFREQAINLCGDRKGRKASPHQKLRFESGNLETLKKMVDQGSGYTLLPLLSAQDIDDEKKRRRLKPFEAPIPTREVSVVTHKHFARHAVVEAIIESIQESLPAEITKLAKSGHKRVSLKIDSNRL